MGDSINQLIHSMSLFQLVVSLGVIALLVYSITKGGNGNGSGSGNNGGGNNSTPPTPPTPPAQ